MSLLKCFRKPTAMDKTVTFYNVVKVNYYRQRPVEIDVNWQQVARDRMRFKRRMLDVEQRIGWVFAKHHRERVYRMQFQI